MSSCLLKKMLRVSVFNILFMEPDKSNNSNYILILVSGRVNTV